MAFRKYILAGAALGALLALGAEAANASTFTVYTNNQNGTPFDALPGAPGFKFTGAATATFTYSGALNFSNPASQNGDSAGDKNSSFFGANASLISGYSGSGTVGSPANVDFTTQTSFLASSGSAAGYLYGSFYTIDLGTLAAGTVLTITHDDGASVYQGSTRIGTTTAGPTSVVTESVTLASAGDTILYYGRQNGTPSILQVQVPEPLSLALVGTGLAAAGLLRRRRKTTAI